MGGGGSTTTVSSAMSDEQFGTLSENQANIATSIDAGRADATEQFGQVDTALTGLGTSIEGVGNNLTTGFTSMQDLMGQNMEANQQAFAGVNENINQSTGAIQTGLQSGFSGVNEGMATGFGNMNQQFADVGQRFDRVDEAQQTAQTTMDTGFQNQANTMSDLGIQMSDGFSAANQTATEGFNQVGQSLSDLDANTQAGLGTVQGNLMAGQAVLDEGIGQMSDTQDIYYDDLAQRQQATQQGQDEFRSNFEDYVERYSDDTTLANQTRADIQSGQVNATSRLREDIGRYADAASQGRSSLSQQIAGVDTSTGQRFAQLGTTVEGGFSQTSAAEQMGQQTLAARINAVNSLLQSTGANLDAQTKAQYTSLVNSFDANGNLIQNAIASNGDTLRRSMDAQGNLLESRFNAAGQQVGQVSTNVEQLLSSAEANQQQTMRTMANNQSGLMSQMAGSQADAADRFTRFQQQIAGGFQNLDAEGVRQAKELASIAAAQTDLDMGMRQNFQQLGDAFDDTGRLVSNTVLENGTAVSRAVDQNGNLLLRSFDATGRDIGTKVININKALSDLGSLPFVAGGNVSMGNLSPAMQGAVPPGGFASPYTMTR